MLDVFTRAARQDGSSCTSCNAPCRSRNNSSRRGLLPGATHFAGYATADKATRKAFPCRAQHFFRGFSFRHCFCAAAEAPTNSACNCVTNNAATHTRAFSQQSPCACRDKRSACVNCAVLESLFRFIADFGCVHVPE